jgi:16S rRNA (cytosine967-C5)-methyltransferase
VLRRHPEALVRRTPADITSLSAKQSRMLEMVAPLVMPGGVLVYSVCTFDRQECEDVVERFVAARPEFRVEAPTSVAFTSANANSAASAQSDDANNGSTVDAIDWGSLTDESGFVRTWPQRHDSDAFFAVRLRCVASA